MTGINKEKIKDIAIRALKTFIQAFLSAISVDALLGVTNLDAFKRVLISILVAAVAAGLSAVMNMLLKMFDAHFAGKGAGTMSLDDFLKRYLGRATDYDGSYGAQCVDFVKMYFKYVFGIVPKAIGNAHAYFDNYSMHSFLKKNFVRIANSPKFIPIKGDVCVFGKKFSTAHKCGHIGIASSRSNLKNVSMYDQNATGNNDAAKETEWDYNRNFLGVLRPIHREGIDGAKIYRVSKAVNIRSGPGTSFRRVLWLNFTPYEQEQVIANGGKAQNNDFPKGMLVMSDEVKGNWIKIGEEKWINKNFVKELI